MGGNKEDRARLFPVVVPTNRTSVSGNKLKHMKFHLTQLKKKKKRKKKSAFSFFQTFPGMGLDNLLQLTPLKKALWTSAQKMSFKLNV